MATGRWYI